MVIKIGDKVKLGENIVTVDGIGLMYSDNKTATIEFPFDLNGKTYNEIDAELKDRCQFSFSDSNKWAWGNQVTLLKNDANQTVDNAISLMNRI